MVSRLDEKLPEGTVYACPICGSVILFNCWHEDTDGVTTVKMSVDKAMELRQNSGEYDPQTFECGSCKKEFEFHPGTTIGNEIWCKECSNSK